MMKKGFASIVVMLFSMAVSSHVDAAARQSSQAGQIDSLMQKIDAACEDPSNPACAIMLNQIEPGSGTKVAYNAGISNTREPATKNSATQNEPLLRKH